MANGNGGEILKNAYAWQTRNKKGEKPLSLCLPEETLDPEQIPKNDGW